MDNGQVGTPLDFGLPGGTLAAYLITPSKFHVQPASKMRVEQFAIREDTLFLYCRLQSWVGASGQRGTKGGHQVTPDTKRKLSIITIFFCYRKAYRGHETGSKHVPDLVESIMRPTCLVKAELWMMLLEMRQFRAEIQEFRVSTFGCPENSRIPAGGQHSKRA